MHLVLWSAGTCIDGFDFYGRRDLAMQAAKIAEAALNRLDHPHEQWSYIVSPFTRTFAVPMLLRSVCLWNTSIGRTKTPHGPTNVSFYLVGS